MSDVSKTDEPTTDEVNVSAPAVTQMMKLGETKTAHVTVDVGESKEKPIVVWTSTGSVLVDQDPEDPTSAKVIANIGGLGTVRASVDFAGRHIEIVSDVVVNEPSIVPKNRIEFE
jgi:hypothetical protein